MTAPAPESLIAAARAKVAAGDLAGAREDAQAALAGAEDSSILFAEAQSVLSEAEAAAGNIYWALLLAQQAGLTLRKAGLDAHPLRESLGARIGALHARGPMPARAGEIALPEHLPGDLRGAFTVDPTTGDLVHRLSRARFPLSDWGWRRQAVQRPPHLVKLDGQPPAVYATDDVVQIDYTLIVPALTGLLSLHHVAQDRRAQDLDVGRSEAAGLSQRLLDGILEKASKVARVGAGTEELALGNGAVLSMQLATAEGIAGLGEAPLTVIVAVIDLPSALTSLRAFMPHSQTAEVQFCLWNFLRFLPLGAPRAVSDRLASPAGPKAALNA